MRYTVKRREGTNRSSSEKRGIRVAGRALVLFAAALGVGCGSKAAPASPVCDPACQDGIALRAVREAMKFAYNWTVQGKPVGAQDATTSPSTFLTGSVHVFGVVTSDPLQGVTNVEKLTYDFTNTTYTSKDDMVAQNYNVVIDGEVVQKGTLAVAPSTTTALRMDGTGLHVVGTVYDPPITYKASDSDCELTVIQSGSDVSGKFCGRDAGFRF